MPASAFSTRALLFGALILLLGGLIVGMKGKVSIGMVIGGLLGAPAIERLHGDVPKPDAHSEFEALPLRDFHVTREVTPSRIDLLPKAPDHGNGWNIRLPPRS